MAQNEEARGRLRLLDYQWRSRQLGFTDALPTSDIIRATNKLRNDEGDEADPGSGTGLWGLARAARHAGHRRPQTPVDGRSRQPSLPLRSLTSLVRARPSDHPQSLDRSERASSVDSKAA